MRPAAAPRRRRDGHPDAGDGRRRGDAPVGSTGGESGPRVLVLTTFDTDEHVVAALRAGASGFLLKDVAPADFVAAIRVVAGGEALSPRRSRAASSSASPTCRCPATPPTRSSSGSSRSARWRSSGWSPRDCPTARSPSRLVLAEPTVKTHVSHLLLKLDLRDRAQLVVLAYEAGVVTTRVRRRGVAILPRSAAQDGEPHGARGVAEAEVEGHQRERAAAGTLGGREVQRIEGAGTGGDPQATRNG